MPSVLPLLFSEQSFLESADTERDLTRGIGTVFRENGISSERRVAYILKRDGKARLEKRDHVERGGTNF